MRNKHKEICANKKPEPAAYETTQPLIYDSKFDLDIF